MTTGNAQLNARWCQLAVDELVRLGITRFCIAPGSRSTPLTLAAARQPAVSTTVHVDERGLGFFATGAARASGKPVAVICTSGTAVANLLPAVVEASMDGVPLLLLTADRPPELRETGANQTIVQPGIFGAHVRWSIDLPAPDERYPAAALRTTLAHAVHACLRPPAGPVHLNFPLREPLLGDPPIAGTGSEREAWRPLTRHHEPPPPQPWQPSHPVAEALATATRGLLIVGRLHEPAERSAAEALAVRLGWPAHADIGSGLRPSRAPAPWLRYYDLLLGAAPEPQRFRPECVLHVGGSFTSKRLWQHLDAMRPTRYVRVSADPRRQDPLHAVTDRVDMTVAAFVAALAPLTATACDPAWLALHREADLYIERGLQTWIDTGESLDEPTVCRSVARELPADAALFLGSSMPIRDMDAFADVRGAAVPVGSNRGASGIDGTLASACGYASGSGRTVLFVCGDLALLHDLNSLALLRRQDPPVIVVLINNDGGGIFSFLPVASIGADFEPLFATPQNLVYADIARAFDIPCLSPTTPTELRADLRAALAAHRPALIEVRTDRSANLQRHREILTTLRSGWGASAPRA